MILISTKPKGIAYKLILKKNAPPTFLMEKEGGGNKGLRTTSKEGIVIVATLALGS
jgi:hypothetical protein